MDLPTRGLSASQLRESHLWWKGPSWLLESKKDWPEDLRSKPSREIVDPKRKSKARASCVVQPKEPFLTSQGSATTVACYGLLLGAEDSLQTQGWKKRKGLTAL